MTALITRFSLRGFFSIPRIDVKCCSRKPCYLRTLDIWTSDFRNIFFQESTKPVFRSTSAHVTWTRPWRWRPLCLILPLTTLVSETTLWFTRHSAPNMAEDLHHFWNILNSWPDHIVMVRQAIFTRIGKSDQFKYLLLVGNNSTSNGKYNEDLDRLTFFVWKSHKFYTIILYTTGVTLSKIWQLNTWGRFSESILLKFGIRSSTFAKCKVYRRQQMIVEIMSRSCTFFETDPPQRVERPRLSYDACVITYLFKE